MNPPSGNKPRHNLKFAPKAPKKLQKPVVPKVEKVETVDNDDARAQELMRRFSESSKNSKGKTEKKGTNVQVAFGYGGTSTNFRSSGSSKNSENTASGGAFGSSNSRPEKEYQEPWDYYSNYPIVLPLRRPYEGNPEHLNKKEFGETLQATRNNENTIPNAAKDLALTEENPEPRLIFFQLPDIVPLPNINQSSAASSSSDNAAVNSCKLIDLPDGCMGKMSVYEDGFVKLKLGETLFDVFKGVKCTSVRDAVSVNKKTGFKTSLGEINTVGVIVPDVMAILDSINIE